MTIYNLEMLENIEDKILAPYGIHSKNSKGRLYPDHEPDYRTKFQRDRDRIIHTSAFRRLEYKTQVFINYEGDHYRTRLTHTLEVAQIGRTIARALGANEDLVETICLAHDLGHSPFGHSGETTLNRLLVDVGGFDHNKQSFRIVTELEKRYSEFPGLNLSWEVLEGIVKHESEYDIADAKNFDPDLRGHIEAQIANVADELAYTAHDLDDGLRSGLIFPDMLSGIEIWEILCMNADYHGGELDDLMRHTMIRKLIGIEISDVLETAEKIIRDNSIRSVEQVQKMNFNVIVFSEEMTRKNRKLKDFLYSNLYRNYRVQRMSVKAERILTELFELYMKEPLILPKHVQIKINDQQIERVICDYIAGMTDRYAIDEYNKLFDPTILP
ncbi:MAG: deoxyguanosinetriphosphate triphosphohydrolase [Chloroflexi bacterium HGW-Chloroflexi-8]|nr:MAG: deoxyguanosinetriphosphate triphosphohydrolase [Chloroflexi bacterium HGW-Chloroflexi-8]